MVGSKGPCCHPRWGLNRLPISTIVLSQAISTSSHIRLISYRLRPSEAAQLAEVYISLSNQTSAKVFTREGFSRTEYLPGVGSMNGQTLDLGFGSWIYEQDFRWINGTHEGTEAVILNSSLVHRLCASINSGVHPGSSPIPNLDPPIIQRW
jgi:hypothetical protein